MQRIKPGLVTDTHRYLFKQCAAIAEALPYAEGYVARANYALARIHASRNEERQSEHCRAAAKSAMDKLPAKTERGADGHDLEAPGTLTPWMLW